ncbi:hypothetical protein FNV43_RR10566 [Rhamnella rubrinervis]|uniref:Uncharacterized protein n=1 Tax=Rhamnella rubrinervis TaxID=2594499 RepID=A0A8K0H474_9ROSA|nr:hypothetical protein FNV43_RR10566 [Rhamnella rubrinervis]
MSNIQNPSSGFSKAKQVHTHDSFLHKEHEQEEEDGNKDDDDEEEIMTDMSSGRSCHSYSRFSACFRGFTKRAPKQHYSRGEKKKKKKKSNLSEKLDNNINAVKKKAMVSMGSAKASVSSVTERHKRVDHHHWDSDAEDESLIGDHDSGSSIGKVETSEGLKFSRENDKKKKRSPPGRIFESCRRLLFGL